MAERDESMSCPPHEHTTPKEPEGNPPSAGRRRFVAGISFSLPAIATLYHGAVLAGPSSMMCLSKRSTENSTQNPFAGAPHLIAPPHVPPQSGDYAVKAVSVRTYTKANAPTFTFYYDSIDLTWRNEADGRRTFQASGNTYTLPENDPTGAALDTQMTNSGYTPPSSSTSGYAVAYVDNAGNIQSLGDDGSLLDDALPAGCSCLTSASPGSCIV